MTAPDYATQRRAAMDARDRALEERRRKQAARLERQPVLFELRVDKRPDRRAAERYLEPMLPLANAAKEG